MAKNTRALTNGQLVGTSDNGIPVMIVLSKVVAKIEFPRHEVFYLEGGHKVHMMKDDGVEDTLESIEEDIKSLKAEIKRLKAVRKELK